MKARISAVHQLEMETQWIHTDEYDEMVIPVDSIPADLSSLDVLLACMQADAGEDGYFVIPSCSAPRTGSQLCRFRMRGDGYHLQQLFLFPLMPIFGIVKNNRATLAIVTGMKYDFHLLLRVQEERYTLTAQFDLADFGAYEDIRIRLIPLEGKEATYSGMARFYRDYQLKRGACRRISERIKEQPYLDYAKDAFSIRIRHGWKKRPTPVLHQTPENEPPMQTAIDFEKTIRLMECFKRHDIDKAEFCLVGWNKSGHDGRFPQHFPVEEQLGGMEGMLRVMKTGKRLGYPVDLFTNSTSAYEVADCWDEEYIAKHKNGNMQCAGVTGSGVAYRVCAQRAYERSDKQMLPKLASLGFRGLHYIDVQGIIPAQVCHDPRHPLNRAQWVEWAKKIMRLSRETFGGYSSEGGYDCYASELDYALYNAFHILDQQPFLCDEKIPLWQLVYHGIILSNPSAETVNDPVKGWREHLLSVEYGSRPVMYYYSKFCTDQEYNWMGDIDLVCPTDEAMEQSVELVKSSYDEYRKRSYLQTQFMQEHTILSKDVRCVRYEDRSEIIVNYGENSFLYNGTEVAPHSYVLIKGEL